MFSQFFGTNTVRPRFTASMAGFGQSLGVDIPLVGEEGLDDHIGAVAMGHGVDIRLDLLD